MRIEFDPKKDLRNRAKHGVSLALAEQLDLESAMVDETMERRGSMRMA